MQEPQNSEPPILSDFAALARHHARSIRRTMPAFGRPGMQDNWTDVCST